MLLIENPKDDYPLLLATRSGQIKALKTGELTNIRPSGLIVMNLSAEDELVSVGPGRRCEGRHDGHREGPGNPFRHRRFDSAFPHCRGGCVVYAFWMMTRPYSWAS